MLPAALVGAALVCLALAAFVRWGAGRGAGGASAPTPTSAAAPPPASPARGRLVATLAEHRWARRTLGGVAGVMVLAAVAVAGYPFLTDQYTETLQTRLEKQLISGHTERAYREKRVEVGDSLTRIRIPKIGVDTVVVEGTTLSALRAGAGHFVDSPLPCEVGNVAIAGHRTTYGKPFADLEQLAIGDEITLETPVGSCTYEVSMAPFEVQPEDYWVVDPTKDAELTLTTCHPEGSARQRLVVRSKQVSVSEEPAA